MNKTKLSFLSVLLSFVMLISIFASCAVDPDSKITTEKKPSETTESIESIESTVTTETQEEISESNEETSQITTEAPPEIIDEGDNEHSELIKTANALANGVQGRFSNISWTAYIVENQNMSFEYRLNKKRVQQFAYLNNTQGQPYFEESFDVFVTMEDGNTYYASNSTEDALINIFKFGYYYNEVHAENQNFAIEQGNSYTAIPTLSLARIFHTYSNKLHTVAQIAASEKTDGIVSIGFRLEIPSKTVAKLVVEDASGIHNTIEGVDWDSAAYIAFDIKNAGILGYILPYDETDKLTVTLEGDNYVVIQSRTPENGTILPGEVSSSDSKGKIGNGNDFYIGQRIYTDENHDFDAFLEEAYIERHPLTQKNIKVSSAYSDYGSFKGYDSLTGAYVFGVGSPTEGIDVQYGVCPNRHFSLNVTIKSDSYQRQIYASVLSDMNLLECAVLLDENLMMIPVPIEVGKNFGGDGDDNIFDLLDTGYGEAIFPIIADSNELKEYNLVDIYQNWGNFPLKQISFIEYHSPYYHLSTGLTETNCLVPWKFTSNSEIANLLPDHRGMSAPLWPDQPQHTSSGVHTFLSYTDTSGKGHVGELYDQEILSYGPTYADVALNHISTDGKIKITYHHIEMPQLDENRGYYTMEYEFLEDLSIKNFKNNWTFYAIGSNKWPTLYEMFSYLDENNQPQIKNFADEPNSKIYVLGDKSPYMSLMKLNSADYGNASIIIKDYEVVINGEKTDTRLAMRTSNHGIRLTLDLGNVAFKAGDKITINAIIMPWGSEQTDYSGKNYAPDQNVRDARENSCLNPIIATAGENTEVVENAFIPMVKTTNGKTAEFTISGGKVNTVTIPYRDAGYNMAVRIYGFDKLSVPIVYELVDGEWVVYDISSANHLDSAEFGAYYDGYSVFYDEDGTYSYSFVINMDEAKARTFKVELDENFTKFPRIEGNEELLKTKSPFIFYLDSADFAKTVYKGWFGKVASGSEGGVTFISLFAHPSFPESQIDGILKGFDGDETGQYVVIKYRFSADNANKQANLEFFTSTVNDSAAGEDSFSFSKELLHDGEWHVVVVDVTKFGKASIIPDEDGKIKLKHLRFDPINAINDTSHRVDIAYFAIHNNLDEIIEFNADEGEITLVEGSSNYRVIKTNE